MYIPDAWLDQFKFFIVSRGGTELKEITSKHQPDLLATFRGSAIWAYKNPGGYNFFGDTIKELEEMWKEAVESAQKPDKEEK